MHPKKWILLVVALIVLLSVFFPWVIIESKKIVISGMQAEGTAYGKPGLFSLFFAGLVFIFSLVPRIWAHRICIFSGALNIGWALRNFLILSTCQGGECPQRQAAFYIYLGSSILLLIVVFVQEGKLPAVEEETA